MELLPARITRHTRPKPMNRAGHFMSEDLRVRAAERRKIKLAAPLMQIRAANVGNRRLEQHCPRLRLR
jgi:hypothetical protein